MISQRYLLRSVHPYESVYLFVHWQIEFTANFHFDTGTNCASRSVSKLQGQAKRETD